MPCRLSQRHKEALSPAKRRPSGSHSSQEEVGRRLARNPSSPPAPVSSPLGSRLSAAALRRLGTLPRSPRPARLRGPRNAKTLALVESQGEWPAGTAGRRRSLCDQGWGLGWRRAGRVVRATGDGGGGADAGELREGPGC